ncbi:MAG TPA: patatin-like phospholipase family protein [Oligoflexia bacterium]|nr:patatin-like phospholipase family protein [Oligoflexia bacterium]
MKKLPLHLIFILFAVSLHPAPAFAAPAAPPPKDKPKIGLVLSGGGAKGIAHVGVLKILEQERIPIHFVSGTSMGSIVAAAYASGLTSQQMEEEFKKVDWDKLFDESIPREDLPYRLKSGRDRRIVGDGKLALRKDAAIAPIAFVQGQHLVPLFQRIFGKVDTPVDFDKLPVPFRAIAADIETGEQVVLKSGDLATTARASMAVPGFFAPVEIDGRMLVDGGIVNNFRTEGGTEQGFWKSFYVVSFEVKRYPQDAWRMVFH